MNQLIPDLSYLHNDNSCTDFGDGYSLLRCRPEAMPHSLTTELQTVFLHGISVWSDEHQWSDIGPGASSNIWVYKSL